MQIHVYLSISIFLFSNYLLQFLNFHLRGHTALLLPCGSASCAVKVHIYLSILIFFAFSNYSLQFFYIHAKEHAAPPLPCRSANPHLSLNFDFFALSNYSYQLQFFYIHTKEHTVKSFMIKLVRFHLKNINFHWKRPKGGQFRNVC